MIIVLLVVHAVLVIGVLLWGTILGARFKGTLRYAPLPDHPPRVSTIVPARNEERNIARCVQGLSRQDYPQLQMIFVDDDSRDATPEILANFAARESRIHVVHNKAKPPDWNGKQWACHSGATQSSGEWLCFMDADTYAEPDLITRTVAFAVANDIDMLTLQPWYEMRGLWERIILPAGLAPLLILFPPERVNNPNDPIVIANGQFILMRRSVYDAVDGHRGVKQRMMDDFSLAESVKGAGYRLFVADGTEVMRVRLYTNLKEIRNGAIKASVELTGGWLSSMLALIANLLINVFPPIFLLWAVLAGHSSAVLLLSGVVIFQLLYYAIARIVAFRAPPWSSITYPIGGIIVTLILVEGMMRIASRREIKWKDRELIGVPDIPDIPDISAELSVLKGDARQSGNKERHR